MTEPIIVDDIDVSGCNYVREDTIPPDCDINCSFCYEFKNRYYKQLKRKEQELTEIKEDIKAGTFCVTCKGENENDKLRVECEKYKKSINDIKIINKDLLKGICDNCGWHNTDGCDPEDFVCGELIKIKQIINEVEND